MTLLETQQEYTPEDLLRMPDGDRYELIDGRLVERHMGLLSDILAGKIAFLLTAFCLPRGLGWVVIPSSGGFQYTGRQVRKPDVAFVRRGRFPDEQPPAGHAALVPDLAVEVISPNDLYEEVEAKVVEYLRVGVRLVWVVSPSQRTVRVHRADGVCRYLREGDQLTGEDVLPDFRCPVADLFADLPPLNGSAAPPPA